MFGWNFKGVGDTKSEHKIITQVGGVIIVFNLLKGWQMRYYWDSY